MIKNGGGGDIVESSIRTAGSVVSRNSATATTSSSYNTLTAYGATSNEWHSRTSARNNNDLVVQTSSYPSTPPPPMPPSCSKRHVYTDTSVFDYIDRIAVSVAQSEVATFTDLIRALTYGASSDVDKAR